MSGDQMIAALDAFVADPTDVTTLRDLYTVTQDFDALSETDQARVVPTMFRLMERWPEADLGKPGPLVHAIESLEVSIYGEMLAESVRRRPMYLNLWMVNRILNENPPDADHWLLLLRDVTLDPSATADAKEEAAGFLDHQADN